MEFILERQAQITVGVARHEELAQRNEQLWRRNEERWLRNEERWLRNEERFEKFDKKLDAIRKLVQAGMKMLVRSEARTDKLEASVKALVELNRRGHNGKNGH